MASFGSRRARRSNTDQPGIDQPIRFREQHAASRHALRGEMGHIAKNSELTERDDKDEACSGGAGAERPEIS